MIGIIGKKLGMTQMFNDAGAADPRDRRGGDAQSGARGHGQGQGRGFASVQLGYGAAAHARESKKGERTPRGRRAHKAELGHAKKAGLERAPRVLRSSVSTTRRARTRRSRPTTSATS